MADLNVEILKQHFEKLADGESAYVTEEFSSDKSFCQAWNCLVDKVIADKAEVATEVNSILYDVTQMNLVRDIVLGMEHQDNAIKMIADNSRQMADAVTDAAQSASNVSENSNAASKLSDDGYQSVSKAFSFVDKSFASIDEVNNQMVEVLEQTKQIDEIVRIIKNIAKQTNLLALNAAIESARAGEHGRGFSVVANEVNKLADNTRESILKIENFIGALQQNIQHSVSNMQNTAEQLKTGKDLVDGALESINEVNKSVAYISGEITHIAASNEEQAATSEEISSETENLAMTTEELFDKTTKTAGGILSLSTRINKLRSAITQNMDGFSKNQIMDMYIVDHMMWRWRVYNMLLGLEHIDPANVGNHAGCRLGIWYYNIDDKKISSDPSFKNIEKPHIEFHRAVNETVQAFAKKDISAAGRHFEDVDRYSKEVVALLESLKD